MAARHDQLKELNLRLVNSLQQARKDHATELDRVQEDLQLARRELEELRSAGCEHVVEEEPWVSDPTNPPHDDLGWGTSTQKRSPCPEVDGLLVSCPEESLSGSESHAPLLASEPHHFTFFADQGQVLVTWGSEEDNTYSRGLLLAHRGFLQQEMTESLSSPKIRLISDTPPPGLSRSCPNTRAWSYRHRSQFSRRVRDRQPPQQFWPHESNELTPPPGLG